MTTVFDTPTIGDLLVQYRKKKHMPQYILADRLGVKSATVKKWENGLSSPSLWSMVRIAKELNVELKEVYSIRRSS